MSETPSINGLLAGIIARELQRIDAASGANCMGDDHRKTLEVIAKILKQNPELGDEAGRAGTVLEVPPSAADLEAALKIVQK